MQGFLKSSRRTISAPRRATHPASRAYTYVLRGEIAFLVFTAVSIAIHPSFVLKGNEGGLSDYGVHAKTVIPYTLALALLALYNRRAAALLSVDDRRSRGVRVVLLSYCTIVSLVLLSTYAYTINDVLKDLHFGLGTVLIVVVCAGSIWMYGLERPTALVSLFLAVQLTGDALSLATVFGVLHVLFLSEMLSNIGFAALLVRTVRRVAMEQPTVDLT